MFEGTAEKLCWGNHKNWVEGTTEKTILKVPMKKYFDDTNKKTMLRVPMKIYGEGTNENFVEGTTENLCWGYQWRTMWGTVEELCWGYQWKTMLRVASVPMKNYVEGTTEKIYVDGTNEDLCWGYNCRTMLKLQLKTYVEGTAK